MCIGLTMTAQVLKNNCGYIFKKIPLQTTGTDRGIQRQHLQLFARDRFFSENESLWCNSLCTLRKENVVASLQSTPDTYWMDKSRSKDTPVLKEVHNCYGADFCQELIRMGCSVFQKSKTTQRSYYLKSNFLCLKRAKLSSNH